MNTQELYDHAVSLLAKRDYSSGELTRTLAKMTENSECVDSALQRLVSVGNTDLKVSTALLPSRAGF